MDENTRKQRDAIPDWKKVLLICGTRTFDNYKLLSKVIEHLTRKWTDVVIVHGGQKFWDGKKYIGADYLAGVWASKNWVSQIVFHAEWDKHGKSAGFLRNEEMAEFVGKGSYCIAFWDGVSPGTKDMIAKAKKYGLQTRVVKYKRGEQ